MRASVSAHATAPSDLRTCTCTCALDTHVLIFSLPPLSFCVAPRLRGYTWQVHARAKPVGRHFGCCFLQRADLLPAPSSTCTTSILTPLSPSPSCHAPFPFGRESVTPGYATGVRKKDKRVKMQIQGGINWETNVIEGCKWDGWFQRGITRRHWHSTDLE